MDELIQQPPLGTDWSEREIFRCLAKNAGYRMGLVAHGDYGQVEICRQAGYIEGGIVAIEIPVGERTLIEAYLDQPRSISLINEPMRGGHIPVDDRSLRTAQQVLDNRVNNRKTREHPRPAKHLGQEVAACLPDRETANQAQAHIILDPQGMMAAFHIGDHGRGSLGFPSRLVWWEPLPLRQPGSIHQPIPDPMNLGNQRAERARQRQRMLAEIAKAGASNIDYLFMAAPVDLIDELYLVEGVRMAAFPLGRGKRQARDRGHRAGRREQ